MAEERTGIRCAIYARMSTDKQSDTSPADQVARCQEFARARGWAVAEELVTMEAGGLWCFAPQQTLAPGTDPPHR
jgi:hypothetical protein